SVTIKDRKRLKHVRQSKELDQNIELAKQALVNIAKEYPLNITELNTLEYVAAAVIADEMRDTPKGVRKELLWKRRLQQKVDQHCRILSIFSYLMLGVTSRHVYKQIRRILRLARKDHSKLEEFTKDIKIKLQARAQWRQRYKKRQQQFYQNKLFIEDTKKIYQLLNKQQNSTSEPPSQPAVETFWHSILEDNVKHNNGALWIKDKEKANQRVTPQAWTELTLTNVLKVIKRAQNWKSNGLDKNFWLKSFNALHQQLTRAM
ncbi:hypothetical protein M9458_037679, partial [Cirrhinus mrigala]